MSFSIFYKNLIYRQKDLLKTILTQINQCIIQYYNNLLLKAISIIQLLIMNKFQLQSVILKCVKIGLTTTL